MIKQIENIDSSMYIKVFIAILAVTALTFIQPFVLGETLTQKVSIQMFLAVIKASLIVMYYMHLKYELQILKIFVLFTVLVLLLLFIITATEVIYRDEVFDLFK